MIALHGDNHHLFPAAIHIVAHAPGLAVGGIGVEKHIVPVEHIHDRVPALRVMLVVPGQINIAGALFLPGELGDLDLRFENHFSHFLFLGSYSIDKKSGIVNFPGDIFRV